MRLVVKAAFVCDMRKSTEIFVFDQLQGVVEPHNARIQFLAQAHARQEFALEVPLAEVKFFRKFVNRNHAIRSDNFINTPTDRHIGLFRFGKPLQQKRFDDRDSFCGMIGRLHLLLQALACIFPDFIEAHRLFGQFIDIKTDKRLQSGGLEAHAENPDFSRRFEFHEFPELAVDEMPLLDFLDAVFEFAHQIAVIDDQFDTAIGENTFAQVRHIAGVFEAPIAFDVAR